MHYPVGRLAPSPTGQLHLGHARTFLLAWWSIRSAGGQLLLRMEDLDQDRVREGYADLILEDIRWLGMDWDGPVVYQSERRDLYDAAVVNLKQQGLLYPCVCTRSEIASAQSAPHGAGEPPYPGTCRDRFAPGSDPAPAGAAMRFRVSAGQREFSDTLAGRYSEDPTLSVGDFPVTRRGGGAAYQLAVVVDDAQQGVTEVLRGADLMPSTIRQGLILDALRLDPPKWVHVPLVVDRGGRRLAKRSGDTALSALRGSGVEPGELVRWAALSAGQEDVGPGLAGSYLPGFRLSRVPGEPVQAWEPPAIQPLI